MEITEKLIKKSCSATIYKRGMEYFREGRVHLRKREDKLISALVDGEELYRVQVKFTDNGEIEDYFCTCPYYETMGSMCKHIVAVLNQRKTELEEGTAPADENDRLAGQLCADFAGQSAEKELMYARFTLYISRIGTRSGYSMSIEAGDSGTVYGIESFLDSVAHKKEYRFDKGAVYNPHTTEFPDAQRRIIEILAETHENRSFETAVYPSSSYHISFGEITAKRIFPLLEQADFSIVFDGIRLNDVRIKDEDPDILIDIDASDSGIEVSVTERGFALVPDGSWFLFDNTVYRTTPEWRSYFMPVYRALSVDSRTQLSFRGDNAIMFARDVLPKLEGKRGVTARGVDEMVVNATPEFEVYFDSVRNGVNAVVMAKYGSISIRIPNGGTENSKIIVRDFEKESELLASFSKFAFYNGTYSLFSDEDIYDFITDEIPALARKAELFYSDRFASLRVTDRVSVRTKVSYDGATDLLEADFETDLSYEQLYGILSAVKLRRKFYRLPNGSFINLEKNKAKRTIALLNLLDFSTAELKDGRKRISGYQALYLDALDGIEKDASFTEYIEGIKKIQGKIPPPLEGIIRPYQRDGVTWLKQLSVIGLGGILADDMGLGKTLQVIAFICGEKPKGPTLVITPSALTYNWLNEISRFMPDEKALIIDGSRAEREKLIETIGEYRFVITSYPLLRRDIGMYKETEFEYCFIDEAQHIKNAKTMNAQSVKKIRARHKFALTGTPVENSLMELWSIFDFVMPDYLYGAREFRSRYEQPISRERDEGARADLKAKIRPFIMRRMKNDVLNELPEKIENVIYAELTAEQKQMYSAYLALAKKQMPRLLSEGGSGRMRILTILMRLRQICCHPRLFDENYKKDSGKLNLLMELIESAVSAGHRTLVFSQFTSMLEIVRSELKERKTACFYLDGKTPSYERAEFADRFNGGERDVFLISLKAGGTGLNLVGADTVIHYDPWWNPAVTEQASDRAYRIGQTRAVQIIRLASRGTIEEKILKLQETKRLLANDIVQTNGDTLSNLNNEEIMALFE